MARQKMIKTKKESIYKYNDATGVTKYAYRYKYFDKFQKRREKTQQGFSTEQEAERALISIKADILDGNESYVESANYTLVDWLQIWVNANKKKWRTGTYELYERHMRIHIIPLIGKVKLNKITNMVMQRDLINPLIEKGLSQRTLKSIARIVLASINSAVEERVIRDNPITKLDFGKLNGKKGDNHFSEEELKIFLNHVYKTEPTTYYTIFLTLGMSGIRKGELAGLRWSDIDFDNNTITVDRTRANKKVGPPKSDNGYRTITVNKILINQLKKYKVWCIQSKWEKQMTLEKDDYVFIDRYKFKPISDTYVNDALDSLLDDCEYDLPRITPHGFRHTFASILIANKVPVVSVAKIIGDHPTTVMNVYAHSLSRVEEETVEFFNRFNIGES
ncbi:tyrosine-type recombinase/integrase [Solibacillus sp. FSL R7-0682]|uniref:tyrosine-type recombinase/integrase n=1 Tax=Solibacillus sp. FSL R7-0682 TaxID=2921690 RepID=UPI0030FB58B8